MFVLFLPEVTMKLNEELSSGNKYFRFTSVISIAGLFSLSE